MKTPNEVKTTDENAKKSIVLRKKTIKHLNVKVSSGVKAGFANDEESIAYASF